ncbi:4Fe-4S dicluster domain-containing protein [Candidatus Bathyarchaeota archaeon]|nr:4Fe-4S dicluster domain-containing protein [Candidatus Bathyarchaeota archaeon]
MSEGSEEEQKVILYEPSRCTGCRMCEMACSFVKYQVLDYSKSHIKHFFDEKTKSFEAIYCLHCEDPICAAVCPTEAISKDSRTGIVRINNAKCIGCKNCIIICPTLAPWFDEERRITVKCDLCDGNPECVKKCSPLALRFIKRSEAKELLEKIYSV